LTENYEWQTEAVEKWVKNGRKGVLQAVPGAGKTRAGSVIVQSVIAEKSPETPKIAIICPTLQIMKQWGDELEKLGLEENNDTLFIRTYFWAAKLSEIWHDEFDLVIYDECHSLMSDVRAKAFNIKKKAFFGLSATPLDSPRLLGGVFLRIGWDEANISPFKIKYVMFPLKHDQQYQYKALTNEVKNAYIAHDEGRIKHEQLMITVMKRRNFVYNLKERIELAVQVALEHPKDRIMIFAERLEQVERISQQLLSKGIQNAVYTSNHDTLDLYQDKKVRVLVSSKMVKEGFNDPETSIGVIASTPLTERNQVQTVGRIIRFFPDKVAEIYIFLASGTSDDKLRQNGMPGETIEYYGGAIDPSFDYIMGLWK
jgi:RNA polymerase primary sigma factor